MIATNVSQIAAAAIVALVATSTGERLLPVVWGMQAEPFSIGPGEITFEVKGYKLKDCQVVGGTFAGWYRKDGEWREAALDFPDDPSPDSSVPSSFDLTNFGLFRWSGVPLGATELRATLTHNCDGSLTITTVGPFDV